MNRDLSTEAEELGAVAERALADLGGVELLRAAIADADTRADSIERALDELGVWSLDGATSALELEAAAAVSRAAGRMGAPYPVPERLAAPAGRGAIALVEGAGANVAWHVDLDLGWSGVDLLGNAYEVTRPRGAMIDSPLSPFASEVEVVAVDGAGEAQGCYDAARVVTLQSWYLLGIVERCVLDTTHHVTERKQFGRRLVDFQGLGFALADLSVATDKLDELARYSLWSQWASQPQVALLDAVALRVAALETAEVVLRGTHQLHGAVGFCDETDVSLLSRLSQGIRRIPSGIEHATWTLAELIRRHGMQSPFGESRPTL